MAAAGGYGSLSAAAAFLASKGCAPLAAHGKLMGVGPMAGCKVRWVGVRGVMHRLCVCACMPRMRARTSCLCGPSLAPGACLAPAFLLSPSYTHVCMCTHTHTPGHVCASGPRAVCAVGGR
jgi:hypothetical protein